MAAWSADCEFAVSSISHARRMAGKRAATAAIRGRIEWPVWAVRNMSARPGGGLCKARFLRIAAVGMADGESRLSTDFVEKQRVAGAESVVPNGVRAPFLSGFARLLRCRKDLG